MQSLGPTDNMDVERLQVILNFINQKKTLEIDASPQEMSNALLAVLMSPKDSVHQADNIGSSNQIHTAWYERPGMTACVLSAVANILQFVSSSRIDTDPAHNTCTCRPSSNSRIDTDPAHNTCTGNSNSRIDTEPAHKSCTGSSNSRIGTDPAYNTCRSNSRIGTDPAHNTHNCYCSSNSRIDTIPAHSWPTSSNLNETSGSGAISDKGAASSSVIWKRSEMDMDTRSGDCILLEINDLLISNNITHYLIANIAGKCRMISHIARKALINGIFTKRIQVDDVLAGLSKEIGPGTKDPTLLTNCLGLLRRLLSMKDISFTRTHALKTLLQPISLVLNSRTGQNDKERMSLQVEYTWLLQVLCKRFDSYASKELSDFTLIELRKLIDSYSDTDISACNEVSHILLVKLLKAVSSVLDVNISHMKAGSPKHVRSIAHLYLANFLSMTNTAQHKSLLRPRGFVGEKLLVQECVVSSVIRMLVFTGLKACASLVSRNSSQFERRVVCKHLHQEVFTLLKSVFPHATDTTDWLVLLFSDHDQMWITALFCLMVVNNGIERYRADEKENADTCQVSDAREDLCPLCQHQPSFYKTALFPTQSLGDHSTPYNSQDLLRSLNPFVCFLQFVRFIDYDPTTLTDFMLSPETVFLAYLTLFLHYLRKSWSVCRLLCRSHQATPAGSSNEQDCTPTDGVCCENYSSRKRHLSLSSSEDDSDVESKASLIKTSVNNDESQIHVTKSLVLYSDSESSNSDSKEFDNHAEIQDGTMCEDINSQKRKNMYGSPRGMNAQSVAQGSPNAYSTSECLSTSSSPSDSHGDSPASPESKEVDLHRVMAMFIRLRFHLQRLKDKKLIPFDISPVLSLIVSCEDIYDNDKFS